MSEPEHFTITPLEETAPAAPLPTPSEYAMAVGTHIQAAFNYVGSRAPQILHPDTGNTDEAPPKNIALTLSNVMPITEKRALFTVTASGMKWPLTYTFLSMSLSGEQFRISPASENYAMPHAENGGPSGYCLDELDSGWPENFAGELVGNYLTGLQAASYDPPVQSIVDARNAALQIN